MSSVRQATSVWEAGTKKEKEKTETAVSFLFEKPSNVEKQPTNVFILHFNLEHFAAKYEKSNGYNKNVKSKHLGITADKQNTAIF